MNSEIPQYQQAYSERLNHARQGMAEHVVEYLIDRIVSGKIEPGSHLVETAIAAELGISKTPIREALRRLPETGLVKHFPYRGTFVRTITPRFVDEVTSLRVQLEGFAVGLALSQINNNDLEMLEDMADRMEHHTQQGDHLETLRLDVRFHTLFFERAKHELLIEMWRNLLPRVELVQAYGRLSVSPMPTGQVKKRHLRIVDVLRSGNKVEVVSEIERHGQLGRGMIFREEQDQ